MATKGKITVNFALRFVAAIAKNRYVALPLRYSTIAYKDIVYYAAKAAHVPESSIEVAMDALYDALSYFVLNGHNVKIDGLGTFAFGINAYAQDDISAAGADAVHNMKVMYLAEMSLRQMLNNVAITTQITNPNGLPVDDTALAEVSEILYRVGNSTNWRKAPFGAQIAVPAEGITVRISGVRMSRQSVVAEFEDSDDSIVSTLSDRGAKSLEYLITRSTETPTYLSKISIVDGATDIGVFWYSYPGAVISIINKLVMNGIDVTAKPSPVAVVSANPNLLNIYGSNMQVMEVTFTNCTAMLQSSSSAMLQYRISAVTGNVVMTCEDPYSTTKTFVFSGASGGGSSSASDPVVTSLSANGISVENGGSSTVQAGQSYNFVFAGANLSGVRQSDLIVPSGATISNFAASANQVSFTLTIGSVGGTIGIRVNGATAFSVSVTIPTNIDASITSIGGVANNGTLQVTPSSGRVTVTVAGTGLNSLSASNFVMSGCTMSLNEGSATERQLTIQGNNGFGGGTLRVQVDGTTIFTVTIDTGGEASF